MNSLRIENYGTIQIWRCTCGFGMDAVHISHDDKGEHWECPNTCGVKDYGDGLIIASNGDVSIADRAD